MRAVSPRYVACIGALGLSAVAAAGPSVEAVWLPVEIDTLACDGLSGARTLDLYLAFSVDPGYPVAVTSDETTGLAITGGSFYQDETGANGPRPEGWYEVFPCARWDSYLTVGGTTPFFSPEYPMLDLDDWGERIVAEWLPNPGDPVEIEIDEAKFGNLHHHVRVARLTGTPGTTSLAGELQVVYFPFPSTPNVPVVTRVQVPNCASCWGSADLNGDGVVGPHDLAIVLAAWGRTGVPADLDGDGVVGPRDLAILLARWGA